MHYFIHLFHVYLWNSSCATVARSMLQALSAFSTATAFYSLFSESTHAIHRYSESFILSTAFYFEGFCSDLHYSHRRDEQSGVQLRNETDLWRNSLRTDRSFLLNKFYQSIFLSLETILMFQNFKWSCLNRPVRRWAQKWVSFRTDMKQYITLQRCFKTELLK